MAALTKFSLTGLLVCLVCLGGGLQSAYAADQTIYVTVRQTSIRGKPLHWAPGLTGVKYGDPLKVSAPAEGGWLHVSSAKGVKGYIHESAITDKEVILKASASAATEVDNSDVVLAGKGFNKQVEEAYARANSAANYSAVNSMEAVQISNNELAAFVKAGKLEAAS